MVHNRVANRLRKKQLPGDGSKARWILQPGKCAVLPAWPSCFAILAQPGKLKHLAQPQNWKHLAQPGKLKRNKKCFLYAPI